jgi:hypothetical protein
VRDYHHNLLELRDALIALVARTAFGRSGRGQFLVRLLEGGPIAESFLRIAGEFTGRTRYFYLDSLLKRQMGIDPIEEFRRLEAEIVEVTSDPEDSGGLPYLLGRALYGGRNAYFKERNQWLIHELVGLAGDIAEACYHFMPLKDPGALAYLMYVRWTEEVPRMWDRDNPVRRPRVWFDMALDNERWRAMGEAMHS